MRSRTPPPTFFPPPAAAQGQRAGAVVSLPSGRYKTALGAEKSLRIKATRFPATARLRVSSDGTDPVCLAIAITNASQIMVRGNTFGPLAESAPEGTPKVLVEKSNDVQFIDNKGISAEEAKERR